MVIAYLRSVNAQEARASMEGIDGTTGCAYSNTRGGVMAQ